MPNGDYEQRVEGGVVLTEGACAGCGARVSPTDAHLIRYSTNIDERGGIFHTQCRPTGAQWYGLGDEGADV